MGQKEKKNNANWGNQRGATGICVYHIWNNQKKTTGICNFRYVFQKLYWCENNNVCYTFREGQI